MRATRASPISPTDVRMNEQMATSRLASNAPFGSTITPAMFDGDGDADGPEVDARSEGSRIAACRKKSSDVSPSACAASIRAAIGRAPVTVTPRKNGGKSSSAPKSLPDTPAAFREGCRAFQISTPMLNTAAARPAHAETSPINETPLDPCRVALQRQHAIFAAHHLCGSERARRRSRLDFWWRNYLVARARVSRRVALRAAVLNPRGGCASY